MCSPNAEELSGGGAERDVGTREVVNGSLREHGVVLDLRLAEWWAVTGDEDELRYNTNNGSAKGTFSASCSSPRG